MICSISTISGNCAEWLITAKTSVDGSYCNTQRTVCRSSNYPYDPSYPRWYKQSSRKCDPKISTSDASHARRYGEMLYAEDNCANGDYYGSWATNTINKGGVYVYIRNGDDLDYYGCSLVNINTKQFVSLFVQ